METKKLRHDGTIEELRAIVENCGFAVSNATQQGANYVIRTTDGATVTWYTTGSINIQGKPDVSEKLKLAWASLTPNAPGIESSSSLASTQIDLHANNKVFVVHGHDDVCREQLELVLHKLGLDPFVLANTGGGGPHNH